MVCHNQKDKLEALAIKILTLDTATQLLKNKGKYARRRKALPAAVALSALIIAVFFIEPFFRNNESLRLPLSIGGAIIGMYCCYILFTNYSIAGLYVRGSDTLRHQLALVDLQKQLKQQFSC